MADINGDRRLDLLFAAAATTRAGPAGGKRCVPQQGPGQKFENVSAKVFGPTPDIARVIKTRDVSNDSITDIIVGTTYQTQSRLYLGFEGSAFTEVTATHLPQSPASIGDLGGWRRGLGRRSGHGPRRLKSRQQRDERWQPDPPGSTTGPGTSATPPRHKCPGPRALLVGFGVADVDNDADLDVWCHKAMHRRLPVPQ